MHTGQRAGIEREIKELMMSQLKDRGFVGGIGTVENHRIARRIDQSHRRQIGV
ncbi:MAG: hypothetical protein U5N85_13820 [Arcicella sp.]|nr:hypothetical protein [Arcicella sp.]